MKSLLLAVFIAIVGTVTSNGQSAKIGLKPNGTITEGTSCTVSWSNPATAPGTLVTVEVIQISDTGETGTAYELFRGNIGSGSYTWAPLILGNGVRSENYAVMVTWNPGPGEVSAITSMFKVLLPKKALLRTIDVYRPTDYFYQDSTAPLLVEWKSSGLPADAVMTVRLSPNTSEAGGVTLGTAPAVQGYFYNWVTFLPAGWYTLDVSYTTPYGAYAQNDRVTVYLSGPPL
jgi:hypothetical protein